MTRGGRRAGTVWTVLACLAAVVAAVLAGTWLRSAPPPLPSDAPRDLAGTRIAVDLPSEERAQVADTGSTFQAPAQGLSVPLRSAVVTDDTLNPPTLTDAYWYRDFADPFQPGSGTAIVAMHSVRGGSGPGNAFADVVSGEPQIHVRVGDAVLLGAEAFEVTAVEVADKQATARDARIWADGASDLVILTCLIEPGVPLADQPNLIVFADRAD